MRIISIFRNLSSGGKYDFLKVDRENNMLAAIWSDVDKLLKDQSEQKLVDINICRECDGTKVIGSEGFPVCSSCGLVDATFIDESPEWTSGISDDGTVNDPSRCGNPNANPELFSPYRFALYPVRVLSAFEFALVSRPVGFCVVDVLRFANY